MGYEDTERILQLEARVSQLEKAVQILLATNGINVGQWQSEQQPLDASNFLGEVKHYLTQKKKIHAIKIYREHTQVGLKEAKDAVDEMEREMRMQGYLI